MTQTIIQSRSAHEYVGDEDSEPKQDEGKRNKSISCLDGNDSLVQSSPIAEYYPKEKQQPHRLRQRGAKHEGQVPTRQFAGTIDLAAEEDGEIRRVIGHEAQHCPEVSNRTFPEEGPGHEHDQEGKERVKTQRRKKCRAAFFEH